MTIRPGLRIVFHPFALDLTNKCLWRDETPIRLRPKTYDVLRVLVERSGQLVTKEQLIEAVWPGLHVTDTVLKVCIRELREQLGDDIAHPMFIQTEHRQGYRFVASVERTNAVTSGLAQDLVVGREHELRWLDDRLEAALQGSRQIVFVTGEPGIGKTTLVRLVEQRAAARDVWVARGQCLEQFGRGEAYLSVLEAFSRLGREPGRERIVSLLARFAPTWLSQMPALADPTRDPSLQARAGSVERMLREMSEAIEALTSDTPLLLVLEDLQWSDPSTADLIAHLARRQGRAQIVVVATYRPAELLSRDRLERSVLHELTAHALARELPLGLLSESEVARYLSRRFPERSVPDWLAPLIFRYTEGNPLFMVSLVDFLLARGTVDVSASEEVASGDLESALEAPGTIRQFVERQLELVGEGERSLLEAASVAGEEFHSVVIAAALDRPVGDLDQQCEALVRRLQFLRAVGHERFPDGTPSATWSFVHALYRNVIYATLPASRRTELHRRTAHALERLFAERAGDIAVHLAGHFAHSGDVMRAVPYYRLSADHALQRFAHREAVALARRGLELLGSLPESDARDTEEIGLQLTLGVPLLQVCGYGASAVEAAYRRAFDLCHRRTTGPELGRALSGMWSFHFMRADLGMARELAARLLALATQTNNRTLQVQARWVSQVTAVNCGDFEEALAHFEEAIACYEPGQASAHLAALGHDPAVACRAFAAWTAWSLGSPRRAMDLLDEALDLAHSRSHPATLVFALFFRAFVYHLRDEVGPTLQAAEETIDLAQEQGFPMWLAFGTIMRGWARGRAGHLDEGVGLLRQGLAAYELTGARISCPHFQAMLAELLGRLGEHDVALSILRKAITTAQSTGERYFEAELRRLEGQLLLAIAPAGSDQVERCFDESLAVAARQRARSLEFRAALSLSPLWCARGRTGDARRLIERTGAQLTDAHDTPDWQAAQTFIRSLS